MRAAWRRTGVREEGATGRLRRDFLDDLERVDAPSAAFVALMSREAKRHRVLLLTARGGAADGDRMTLEYTALRVMKTCTVRSAESSDVADSARATAICIGDCVMLTSSAEPPMPSGTRASSADCTNQLPGAQCR